MSHTWAESGGSRYGASLGSRGVTLANIKGDLFEQYDRCRRGPVLLSHKGLLLTPHLRDHSHRSELV